jgi:putative ABC transport system permease protein
MLAYYLQLGLRSLRRNPMLTALMVVAIGFGVAASMTTYAVFRATSGDPIPEKSSQLFLAQVDNYGPSDEDNGEPQPWITWRDATTLMQAHQAKRQSAIYPIAVSVISADPTELAYPVRAIATYTDLFPMLDIPFLYGGPWSANDDESRARVVVIGKELNDRVFAGANSVGREINLDGTAFRVVGVMRHWEPRPNFLDLSNHGGFGDPGEMMMPFNRAIDDGRHPSGGTVCNRDAPPGWDGFVHSECVFISFWAELPDAASATRYRGFLHDYAAAQQRAGRFGWAPNVRLRDVMTWLQKQKVVPAEARMSLVIAVAFLLICLVNTVGLLLAKFMRRAPEIGVRRALGASRGAIYVQFLVEAAAVGLAGGVLGVVLTGLGMLGVGAVFDPAIARLAHVDVALIAMTVLTAIASTVLAAFYPTWRAAQVQPAWQLKSN